MNKIRKGDQVVVLSGKDKGRQGTVLLVDGEKVTVENINKAKKHQKPRQGQQAPGAGRNHRQGDAAAHFQDRDLERGRQEGRSRRHQAC